MKTKLQLAQAVSPRVASPSPVRPRVVRFPWETTEDAAFWELLDTPESELSQVVERLIASPVAAKRMAISGSALTAFCMAMALARQGEKVCLLEFASPEQALYSELTGRPEATGLSNLFLRQVDLEHLILQAKQYRPLGSLYILPTGTKRLNWTRETDICQALLAALSKKFHHVICSVPDVTGMPGWHDWLNTTQVDSLTLVDTGRFDREGLRAILQRFGHVPLQVVQ